MLKVNNRAILDDTVAKLNKHKINDIYVVRGYMKGAISGDGYNTIDNAAYAETNELYSLYLARHVLEGESLIMYGDCLYRSHLITDMLDKEADIRILVDADKDTSSKEHDHVMCSRPYTNDFLNKDIYLQDISVKVYDETAHGEWAGIIASSPKGTRMIRDTLEKMSTWENFNQLALTDMLRELIPACTIQVVYTKGGWLDVDNLLDIADVGEFL
jgi:phosphoenolpyruvate phosphomutase